LNANGGKIVPGSAGSAITSVPPVSVSPAVGDGASAQAIAMHDITSAGILMRHKLAFHEIDERGFFEARRTQQMYLIRNRHSGDKETTLTVAHPV
jgi:hypothetical protein